MKTGINHSIKTGLLALCFFGSFGIFTSGASAAYFDNAPAPKCDVQITKTLQTGSEGVEVVVLQNFLNRAGLLSAVPNGYYGPATKAAVKAFQRANYISVTGSVGSATRNAINERMCDTDLSADNFDYSYDTYYGSSYSSGVTYVDSRDPFVQVVSPASTNPIVYNNPQTIIPAQTQFTQASPVVNQGVNTQVIVPGTTNTGIASTNIIYTSSIGYTYGITPTPGALTITTPSANASYKEGDTVRISWVTSNLSANGYTILLENTSTNQSKAVATVTGNTATFVLSKDVLDAVCGGGCNNPNYGTSYQGTFRIVVTTPMRDISGNISTFRAAVSPVFITRPNSYFGTVSITASKTPINSGELFKLYVNIPTGASWDANIYGQYSFKIRATCPSGTTAAIAGVQCGQDFVIPFAPTYFQSEIPALVGNSTWYPQNITFTLTVTNLQGQVLGTSQVNIQANPMPFSW